MAPTSRTYFDYYQSRDTAGEPLAIGGFVPLDSVYAFDPVPPELTPQEAKHILGGQGQIWTEYMVGPRKVEYMAFPRMDALAEVLWTPQARKDLEDFHRRLRTQLWRYHMLSVDFRPPDFLYPGR
jgi:hexosaminidase